MRLLDLRLLGPPRVLVGGRPVDVRSTKALALLCYLGTIRQVHARDRLAALLWPDVPDRNAQASLRTALYELRRAFGHEAGALLFVERTRVGLRADAAVEVDLTAVEAAAAVSGTPEEEAPILQAAVDAYRGPFLDGLDVSGAADFADWVFLERERLETVYAGALWRLAQHHGRSGRLPQAIEAARAALAIDPLREDVHRALMRYLALSGQRASALAQYRACANVLRDELDLAPLPATTELYERIRANLPPGDDVSGPAPLARAVTARLAPAIDAVPPALEAPCPLVGRSSETAALTRAWRATCAGTGSLVVVEGEAGIGKSRLVGELCALAAADGRVVVGRCHEAATNEPYGPIVDAVRCALTEIDLASLDLPEVWQRELGRILPELAPALPPTFGTSMEGVRDRDRLFDGVRAFLVALAARSPVLLVVEDAHWADETSLSLLAYIARGISREPLAIVVTLRGEDVPFDRRPAVRTLARHGRRLLLPPLSAAETGDLVAALSETTPPPAQFGDRMHRLTGGNPFFVIETLRALFEQGSLRADVPRWTTVALSADDDYAGLPVPESVGLIVAGRLDRLTDDARLLLEAAGVMRRDFEFDLAQAASGLPPAAALDGLDALVGLGLLREVAAERGAAGSRYDFAHALVRDHVYGTLTGARRQHLHRRVAGLFESVRPIAPDRIAYHYLRGGVRDRACAWSLRAGAAALRVHAAEGALVHFRTARELAVEPLEECPALEGIGDAFVGLGRHAEAILSYAAALPLAADGEARADLHRRIGRAHERQGAYDRALAAYGDARKELHGRPLSLESIRIADGLATVYVRLGRHDEATELCQDALAWLRRHPDVEGGREAEAWLSNTLGMGLMHAGDYPGAVERLTRSLALKRELGDRLGEATLLHNLGVVNYHRGDDDEAGRYYTASLEIKTEIGDGYGQAIALTNLALIETHLGEFDAARGHLESARSVAGAVGAAWLLPEILRVDAQRALALGDLDAALEAAQQALEAAEALGVPVFIGVAHRVMGVVKAALAGEPSQAREHFETSLAVFEMLDSAHELAKTHAAYGETLVALGLPGDAEAHLRSAAEVFARSGAEGRLRRLEPLLGP